MSQPEPPVDREPSPLRRLLSRVDRWASHPLTALIVIAAHLAWVLLSVAMGFPGLEERIFQTLHQLRQAGMAAAGAESPTG